MNTQTMLEMLAEENIFLKLDGPKLKVSFRGSLQPEDRDFILRNKPAIMAHLQQQIPLVDRYGRRQCQTCSQWAHNRCNHRHYTGITAYGKPTYYTPNPELWMRCEYHSAQINEQENNA